MLEGSPGGRTSAVLWLESHFSSFLCIGGQATAGYPAMNMKWRTRGFLLTIGGDIDECRRRHLVLFHPFCDSTCAETALSGSDTAAVDRTHRAAAAFARHIACPSSGDDELPGIPGVSLHRRKRLRGSSAR